MGEIVDAMLNGILCAGCGVALEDSEGEDYGLGMPMYCSEQCAKEHDADKSQVCPCE